MKKRIQKLLNLAVKDEVEVHVVHETAKVRHRGIYLDGVYTRGMAIVIKQEAEQILDFFARQDTALKKSMEKTK
jgi:hypothetical protein